MAVVANMSCASGLACFAPVIAAVLSFISNGLRFRAISIMTVALFLVTIVVVVFSFAKAYLRVVVFLSAFIARSTGRRTGSVCLCLRVRCLRLLSC